MNKEEKDFLDDIAQIMQLAEQAEKDKWQGKESPRQLIQRTLDRYQHYWHPEDKAWMEARKDLWVSVFRNIKQLSHSFMDYKKPEFVILKALFFTGKLDYGKTANSCSRLMSNILFFYFWFFPEEPTIEIMQPLFDTLLGSISYPAGGGLMVHPTGYPPPYGLMGGREKLFIEVFHPSRYWKNEIKVASHSYYETGESQEQTKSAGIRPRKLLSSCCGETKLLLTKNDVNPFAFGQYLWDRFDYNYEHHLNEFDKKKYLLTHIPGIEKPPVDKTLVGVLNLIQGFYEHEKTLKDSPLAEDLHKRLYERFATNGFSSRLQEVWEDIKFSRENTTPCFYFDWNKYNGTNTIKLENLE